MAGPVTGISAGLLVSLGEFTQLVGERLGASCKTNPGVSGVQEICTKPGGAIVGALKEVKAVDFHVNNCLFALA